MKRRYVIEAVALGVPAVTAALAAVWWDALSPGSFPSNVFGAIGMSLLILALPVVAVEAVRMGDD